MVIFGVWLFWVAFDIPYFEVSTAISCRIRIFACYLIFQSC